MEDLHRADSLPHGQKRRAEDELENDQRLAKRFNLLNLGMGPSRFLLYPNVHVW